MSDWLIVGLALSIMFNIMIIVLQVFTGVGRDAIKRFFWKKKHSRGGYAYSILATRDGIIKEVFEKVEEGKFKWNKQDYIREPRMMRTFKGIPANFHREGNPAPIDPWNDNVADYLLSCAEMDTVMNAQNEFNFLEWVKENKALFVIGALVVVGVIIASAYFGYSSYQLLRDGGNVVSSVVSAS